MAGDTEQLLKALEKMEEKITKNINNNIDQKFERLTKELQDIKLTNKDQEKRISLIERQLREKNLIFFGVPEGEKSYEELEIKIVGIINKKMEIECSSRDIEAVQRIGKKEIDKIRPVNITFVRLGTKIKILKLKKSLESSSIYIKHDYPQKVLEIRKTLKEQVRIERERGNKAVIKYDKIIVTKNTESSKNKPNFGQKRPLNITPPQTKNTEESRNELIPNADMQTNKKNKTMSYGIRQYTQNRNKDNTTPENQ
ncbi:putative leucine-rich repeat-containing protein DDB_G0290503 [Maniola jurtina]|uniref:putative leucine-rich repeat-containing protein DDB_G0290503 n=1 Tax=Maniola jurtina TaxID=191418 RepID=UPI001E68CB4A|nr:putative leucine-rich repeat-containing protein DDB_G0290503 [Maniola jurtina]XP_045780265.1 putative leucine-rich repeat-containing protein DDB_G0290503 [Maniola jurtina]